MLEQLLLVCGLLLTPLDDPRGSEEESSRGVGERLLVVNDALAIWVRLRLDEDGVLSILLQGLLNLAKVPLQTHWHDIRLDPVPFQDSVDELISHLGNLPKGPSEPFVSKHHWMNRNFG